MFISRYAVCKISLISALIMSFSGTALAQQGENEASSDVGEADDSGQPEGDETTEEESAEGEAEEAESEDESLDETEESSAPESIELDMKALGDMDPEKELTERKVLTEDEAAADVIEDWTERDLDLLEVHGYFRVRPELYHKFYMRHTDNAVYDRPAVMQYPDDPGVANCSDSKAGASKCDNATLAGANMRLRVEPSFNISEDVRVKTQIDFLDNVMLGSTPRYWQNYAVLDSQLLETGRIEGWDMGPPSSGDMISVRRAWGEVTTQLGELRFGRMGDHWGLGLLHNSGNGIEQDFGNSVDRIMFAAKINDWMIAPAFDFPNDGYSAKDAAGYPFDVSQLDDSYRLSGILAYKHDREEQLSMLKRGEWVINTGLYFSYRWQTLSFENLDEATSGDPAPEFYRRDMWAMTPDLWFQLLYDTLHVEIEAVLVYGEVNNPDLNENDFSQSETLRLLQYGAVAQIDYGVLSDQLRFGAEIGFASGDKGVDRLRAPSTYDQVNVSKADDTFSAFSFNPSFNTDLILYRHILGSINQSYYFHPWLRYDFLRSEMGKKLGFQADVIYSRAVYKASTIGKDSANLGIEVNIQARYESEDRFFAGLKYGALFPLNAFKGTVDTLVTPDDPGTDTIDESVWEETTDTDLTVPQTLQLFLGISF